VGAEGLEPSTARL